MNDSINTIISRYGNEGYKHLINTLAYICNTNRFNTYYFLDEFKTFEWISSVLPSSREGYILENVDLLLRRYTQSDKLGTFKIIELKNTKYNRLRKAQELMFGLIDRMLNTSSESYRYEGFYLARIDLKNKIFIVNDRILTEDEFKSFLQGELQIEPYKFRIERYLQ